MDHIPKVKEPLHHLPAIPFLQDVRFKYSAPVHTFPSRIERKDLDPNQKNWTKVYSSFVQSWLFFGTLSDFLQIHNLPFNPQDFVAEAADGTCVMTNALLKEYLVAWIMQEHLANDQCLTGDNPSESVGNSSGMTKDVRTRTSQVSAVLKHLQYALAELVNAQDVDPRIWDSLVILGGTLARAVHPVFRSMYENIHSGRPMLDFISFAAFELKSFLDFRRNQSWCPCERRIVAELVEHSPCEVAFFSQINQYEHPARHQSCDERACAASQIKDPDSDVTKHATEQCTCALIGFEVENHPTRALFSANDKPSSWTEQLRKRLPKKFQSVSAITFTEGAIRVVQVPLIQSHASGLLDLPVDGWNLVAISHIWSDGLGNPRQNKIYSCQLKRLQSLVDALYKESQRPVPFWIDSLMIPKTNATACKTERDAFVEALGEMERIYKSASKVLILDRNLQQANTEGMSPEEVGARILCSPWSRRLWTLQEACVDDRAHFLFQNGTIKWPRLHSTIQKTCEISNWEKNCSRLPPSHTLRKFQKYPGLLTSTKTCMSELHALKMRVDKRGYRALNPVWPSIMTFLEDFGSTTWGNTIEGITLPKCMRSMFYRQCSQPEDESLVLSAVMHTTAGSAAKLSRITDFDARYLHLFKGLREVPQDILFVDQERYREPGKRWIPKTLLSMHSPSSRPISRTEKQHHAVFCYVSDKGLGVHLDAFSLLPNPRTLPSFFRFAHEESHYQAFVRRAGSSEPLTDIPKADWVLMPESSFFNSPSTCQAALLSVRDRKRRQKETLFEGLVSLTNITTLKIRDDSVPLVDVELIKGGNRAPSWRVG